MNVGWVGLGKLGLTCAVTLAHHAQVNVIGYDPDPRVPHILDGDHPPLNNEEGLVDLLNQPLPLKLAATIDGVVEATDGLVFCAVQTPHQPEYGGERPMPISRADFDYSYLIKAAKQVSESADRLGKNVTLVVISTALPGTMRKYIIPELSHRVKLVYNPFFIAMGTTVRDFLHPEFVLIGCDFKSDAKPLLKLYHRLHGGDHQAQLMSVESAELTKVAYNTFISMKIVFANTLMEICHDVPGADVDEVTDALAQGYDRIISAKYLSAGMGDGGACHPRDNIAMSWLAKKLNLATDPFEYVTRAREHQSDWLARTVITEARKGLRNPRPIVLLGKSYKPESDLIYGSPALLLAHQLAERGYSFEHWDEHVDGFSSTPRPNEMFARITRPAVWVICTKHPEYATLNYPPGSIVIDPFGYVEPAEYFTLVSLGRQAPTS